MDALTAFRKDVVEKKIKIGEFPLKGEKTFVDSKKQKTLEM